MKIWKKIFLYSITLFIILFNGAGIIIIQNIYNRNLNNAIIAAINEEKNIKNSIYLNADFLKEYSSKNIWSVIRSYIYGDVSEIENIEIFDENNNLIGSVDNLGLHTSREEVENASINENKFVIRNVNGKKLVFVSTMFKINDETYKLVITKDISFLNIEKQSNYNIFFVLSLAVTIILAIGMYIISKNITRPIKNLIEVSNSITNGDYSKRATNIESTDEIGVLANNFNIMMQEIEDKIDELNYINEGKQRFIDNLTHEMKTPITSIIGYSDLLLKGNINEDIKMKSLDYINSQGRRLENLNTSLIKLIMIKNTEILRNKISINEILIETFKGLKFKLDNKNLYLIKEIKEDKVLGDKQLLILLLINILDNSIKASENNSSITLNGDIITEEKYRLIIKDEGGGISEEDIRKVKEPFYMADKSRSVMKKNFGLGLAICQEICEANKISFNIESEVGKGTEVTLIFERKGTNEKDY